MVVMQVMCYMTYYGCHAGHVLYDPLLLCHTHNLRQFVTLMFVQHILTGHTCVLYDP